MRYQLRYVRMRLREWISVGEPCGSTSGWDPFSVVLMKPYPMAPLWIKSGVDEQHRRRSGAVERGSAHVVGDQVRQRLVDVDPEVLVAGNDHVIGSVQKIGELLGGGLERGMPGRGVEL